MTKLELIADVRSTPPDVAANLVLQWAAEDPGSQLIGGATIVLPPGADAATGHVPPGWRLISSDIGAGFWDAVLATAGRAGRAAVTLTGPVHLGLEAVGVMLQLLRGDPMYGAAAARVQCWDGCSVQTVPRFGGREPEWLPLPTLAELSPHELLGEIAAPCILLQPLLLTDFGGVEPPFESLAGAILGRLIAARRCGLRTVLANRAVVRVVGADCGAPAASTVSLAPGDQRRVGAFDAELERSWLECRGAANELFETMTGQRLRVASGTARPSLLLDMRNVRATFNGTTFAAIGAAWGLYQADRGWDVAVLAHPDGAPFHDFGSMFPGWRVCTAPPAETFTAALRLSQPWHIQEMVDLHHSARVNAYLMLDTIAWDVQYVAPLRLDGTWRFLAASADGLLFISQFSEQRFCARFPGADATARTVCHLSFAPDDYTRPELADAPQDEYILVVGNDLDHKDVRATVGAIAAAFPFERIEALGPSPVRSPRIRTHKSGNLADLDVHRLYASAKMIVFPSFYEGFGFPVVTALAYGRTLLARDSALLHEVAPQCSPRGRLIGYQQRDDVVDTIGRLLHGERVAEIPVGGDLDGNGLRSWRRVGVEIDEFLRQLTSTARASAWRARDELVNHALAYRT